MLSYPLTMDISHQDYNSYAMNNNTTTSTDDCEDSVSAHLLTTSFNDITFTRSIGRGTFGEVWKAQMGDRIVAVKKFLVNPEDLDTKTIQMFNKELGIMRYAHHKNVMPLLGCCMPPDPLCIITELALCSLNSLLRNNEAIDWVQRIHYCTDICSGMAWLHAHRVIHNDLKPSNVLVMADGTLKVADFGLSVIAVGAAWDQSVSNKHGIGTIVYSGPEVFQGLRVSAASDVYSFAITAWQLLTRSVPFIGMHHHAILFNVVANRLRPPLPPSCESSYATMIIKCWHSDPKRRPTFQDVIDVYLKEMSTEVEPRALYVEDARVRNIFIEEECPSCWNVDQVVEWLKGNNFSYLIEVFRSNDVTGRVLLTIRESDLRDIFFVQSFGKRREFIFALDQLRDMAGLVPRSSNSVSPIELSPKINVRGVADSDPTSTVMADDVAGSAIIGTAAAYDSTFTTQIMEHSMPLLQTGGLTDFPLAQKASDYSFPVEYNPPPVVSLPIVVERSHRTVDIPSSNSTSKRQPIISPMLAPKSPGSLTHVTASLSQMWNRLHRRVSIEWSGSQSGRLARRKIYREQATLSELEQKLLGSLLITCCNGTRLYNANKIRECYELYSRAAQSAIMEYDVMDIAYDVASDASKTASEIGDNSENSFNTASSNAKSTPKNTFTNTLVTALQQSSQNHDYDARSWILRRAFDYLLSTKGLIKAAQCEEIVSFNTVDIDDDFVEIVV